MQKQKISKHDNIDDIEIKKILILLTNSFERKLIDNIGNSGTKK